MHILPSLFQSKEGMFFVPFDAELECKQNVVVYDSNSTNVQETSKYSICLCILGNFSCFRCRLLIFFKINFFRKILSGTLTECQTIWIWVQTVCKGFQHRINSASLRARKDLKI